MYECRICGGTIYRRASDKPVRMQHDMSSCKRTVQETIPIAPNNHLMAKVIPGKAATCTQAGLTDGSICGDCGTVLTAQEEIPALGHTPAEAVVENEVAASCVEGGTYESVVCCSVCGEEISRETVETDALGHTGAPPPARRRPCASAAASPMASWARISLWRWSRRNPPAVMKKASPPCTAALSVRRRKGAARRFHPWDTTLWTANAPAAMSWRRLGCPKTEAIASPRAPSLPPLGEGGWPSGQADEVLARPKPSPLGKGGLPLRGKTDEVVLLPPLSRGGVSRSVTEGFCRGNTAPAPIRLPSSISLQFHNSLL